MQHRIKGQLTLDGPSYSLRARHPFATRLWSDGYAFQTAVGRWAVVCGLPGSQDPNGAWRLYASINVARMTSYSRADAYARRHRSYGPHFRARVVRWHRWMNVPRGIVPVGAHTERSMLIRFSPKEHVSD